MFWSDIHITKGAKRTWCVLKQAVVCDPQIQWKCDSAECCVLRRTYSAEIWTGLRKVVTRKRLTCRPSNNWSRRHDSKRSLSNRLWPKGLLCNTAFTGFGSQWLLALSENWSASWEDGDVRRTKALRTLWAELTVPAKQQLHEHPTHKFAFSKRALRVINIG
jgi:hypothetical protein